MNYKNAGRYLLKARTKSGLTQTEVEKMTGLNKQFLSNSERKICYVPAKYLNDVQKAYTPHFSYKKYIHLASIDVRNNFVKSMNEKCEK